LPKDKSFDQVVSALIAFVYPNVPPPDRPVIDKLFKIDYDLPVPIIFSDSSHPAAMPGYEDVLPAQRATEVFEDGVTRYYLQPEPTDRWYVVIRGVDFHGVVHGAALWATMVPGFKNAKGMQMPTRAAAEHAYRVAVARGDVRALPRP
jgi:hypothetical protein